MYLCRNWFCDKSRDDKCHGMLASDGKIPRKHCHSSFAFHPPTLKVIFHVVLMQNNPYLITISLYPSLLHFSSHLYKFSWIQHCVETFLLCVCVCVQYTCKLNVIAGEKKAVGSFIRNKTGIIRKTQQWFLPLLLNIFLLPLLFYLLNILLLVYNLAFSFTKEKILLNFKQLKYFLYSLFLLQPMLLTPRDLM